MLNPCRKQHETYDLFLQNWLPINILGKDLFYLRAYSNMRYKELSFPDKTNIDFFEDTVICDIDNWLREHLRKGMSTLNCQWTRATVNHATTPGEDVFGSYEPNGFDWQQCDLDPIAYFIYIHLFF